MLASTTGLWYLETLGSIAMATCMVNTHGRTRHHLHLEIRRLANYPALVHLMPTLSTHIFWNLTHPTTTTSSRRRRSSLTLLVPLTRKALLVVASAMTHFRCPQAVCLEAIYNYPDHLHNVPHTPSQIVHASWNADLDNLISIPAGLMTIRFT